MKNIAIFVICASIAAGCGPVHKKVMVTDECAPTNLTISPNDKQITLKWDTNCPKDKLISGYFVYLEPKPIKDRDLISSPPRSVKPFNLAPYPGDTNPENRYETMFIDHLDNGVEYYVSVRTVFPDNTLSVSSNQVDIMCRPEGSFELAYRYAALNDGFSFLQNESVRADAETNDLYFYHKDGFDYIASPHRINGYLRTSRFYALGNTKDIYQYPTLNLDFDPVEKMPALVGESYIIKTADNNYVKVRIEDASGDGKQRVLKIKYIYQTKMGHLRF